MNDAINHNGILEMVQNKLTCSARDLVKIVLNLLSIIVIVFKKNLERKFVRFKV